MGGYVARTIDYVYDPLNRLTEANYDDATHFHYVYEPVGNRLTEEMQIGATSYAYDAANRLTDVAGQANAWDANGNLLSDGASSYTYDKANQLVGVQQGGATYTYAYNGLGDRVGQTEDSVTTNYALDLAAGLTQVLSDGTSAYLYGLGRVGEQGAEWQYHLGDALGSVRQRAGADGVVSFAQSYAPYGSVLSSGGGGATAYGYTGEWTDGTGLVHLRARYLDTGVGRFTSRDVWDGNYNQPITYNKWQYAYGNPVTLADPSGLDPAYCLLFPTFCAHFFGQLPDYDGLEIVEKHRDLFMGNRYLYTQSSIYIIGAGLDPITVGAAIAMQSQWLNSPIELAQNALYVVADEVCALVDDPRVKDLLRAIPGLESPGLGYGQINPQDIEDPFDMAQTIVAMVNRIKPATDKCTDFQCSARDKIITAALAQNVGFDRESLKVLKLRFSNETGGTDIIDWGKFFRQVKPLSGSNSTDWINNQRAGNYVDYNTRWTLQLFLKNMLFLHEQYRWPLPQGLSKVDLTSLWEMATNP